MGRFSAAMDQTMTVFTREAGETAARQLAELAREKIGDVEAAHPAVEVETWVNGRQGVPLESLRIPGSIVALFDYMPEAIPSVLAFAQERAPVLTGAYRRSIGVWVNGASYAAGSYKHGDEIIIAATVPYARRVEIGKRKDGKPWLLHVPPGIMEDTARWAAAQWRGVITVRSVWVDISAFAGIPDNHAGGPTPAVWMCADLSAAPPAGANTSPGKRIGKIFGLRGSPKQRLAAAIAGNAAFADEFQRVHKGKLKSLWRSRVRTRKQPKEYATAADRNRAESNIRTKAKTRKGDGQ